MSPIRLKKYFPEFAICAVALIPLAMGACTFKLGEPVRLYGSNTPATAEKPAPSPTPGGSTSSGGIAANKTAVKAPGCAFSGGAALENNKNLSTLKSLQDEVDAQIALIHDESDLREKITDHAKALGILDKKSELRKLYTEILAMPALALRAPVAVPSAKPSDQPATAASNPLSGAITAFVIHKHVYELAVKPANEGGLGRTSEKAGILADKLYKYPLETLAALKQAFSFAQDKNDGLGLELKPALDFCDSVLKSSNPAQTIIAYISTFQRELFLSGTKDKAKDEADKATCLTTKSG